MIILSTIPGNKRGGGGGGKQRGIFHTQTEALSNQPKIAPAACVCCTSKDPKMPAFALMLNKAPIFFFFFLFKLNSHREYNKCCTRDELNLPPKKLITYNVIFEGHFEHY